MALVILGHPNFANSLANKTIIEILQDSSIEIEIRNLADLYPDYQIDAKKEQKALMGHQTIIFQYPLYWYNMPAILKQWFDVVFEYQFAYGSQGDKLKGKNFLPSFTIGAPADQYCAMGDHHFRVYEFCKNLEQTAYYAQMNYCDPIYFHGTSAGLRYSSDDIANKARLHAHRLLECLRQF